ncbi:MAG: hypothetical protein ACI4TZ_00050 [Christensenellales bacterium]
MKHYDLKEDEVVLYKGKISFADRHTNTQLVLTNYSIVFITITSEIGEKETAETEVYLTADVKNYKGIPQIKSTANNVEIFFKSTEKEFVFETKNELHKFVSELNKLLTGKTGAERNAEKFKSAIGLVNDTLGVDIVQTANNLIQNGFGGSLGKIGKSLFNKKKK